MKKILKLTAILLGIIVSLLILAAILLILFVSPSRLKPILSGQVMKYTGRQLTIDGDMSWRFFPYLGVKLGHMTLSNPGNFSEKTFAEISNATVGVRLMPLLHGAVESSGMTLNGMQLHLIKNASGQNNWSFSPMVPATPTTQPGRATKKAMFGLAISGVDISNATITYADEQAKKSYIIKQFGLHAKDINLIQPFPLSMAFDFVVNTPATSGHVALTGNVALNLAAQVYTFRELNFSADLHQGDKKMNIDVSGDVMADINRQTLEWTGFNGKIADVTLAGAINVTHLTSHPVATGHLKLDPFDLREILKSLGQDVSDIQIAKTVAGDVDFTAGTTINVLSHLKIDTLQVANLLMNDVQIKAHFQDGVLDLAPITANLYQGSVVSEAKINTVPSVPQMTLHAKLTNVQAEPLMQDLSKTKQKITISGMGNVEVQLATAGTDSNSLMQNLNGTGQFNFSNGALVGLDLGYMVDTASAVAKLQAPSATNNDRTNFGTLTATATIRNGLMSNTDLLSDAPRFVTHGSGTINLVNQTIDYTLQTTVKQRTVGQKNDVTNLYGASIPVLITGSLSNPSIRLDSAAITKTITQQQVQRVTGDAKQKIKEQIKNKLGDKLNGKAGDVLNNLLGN